MSINSKKNQKEKVSFKKDLLDFTVTLLISMAVVFLLVNYVVRPIRVVGNSMYPTLESDALGFSNVIGRNTDGISRFDIVVIKVTEDSRTKYLVKRVIGMPGDTVSYNSGVLYINGEAMDESFLNSNYVITYGGKALFTGDIAKITLGEDEYYCLGDNRPFSRDSRYYGPFKSSSIISKGALILLPFSDFGLKSW
ncbi:MAG: signal peptidase I [Erysipelotrichia bacterium]|nr:signal peptidase I [Erysipelotrichia bacterium]